METAKFYAQTTRDREVMTRVHHRFMDGLNGMFIGIGWTPLIVEMEERLHAIDPDYTLHSIVDRDGQMRISFATAHTDLTQRDAMASIVHEIEQKSTTVCELTGQPGSPTGMDGQTYTLSAAAAAYYVELEATNDDDVSFDFPEFTAVFEFDGEPAEAAILSEAEVRFLALLGRPTVEAETEAARKGETLTEEASGISIGYLDYEEYEGVIDIGGNDYTVRQVAEFIAAGIPHALRISLDGFIRDTQNPDEA